jgi:hypothetical protein
MEKNISMAGINCLSLMIHWITLTNSMIKKQDYQIHFSLQIHQLLIKRSNELKGGASAHIEDGGVCPKPTTGKSQKRNFYHGTGCFTKHSFFGFSTI